MIIKLDSGIEIAPSHVAAIDQENGQIFCGVWLKATDSDIQKIRVYNTESVVVKDADLVLVEKVDSVKMPKTKKESEVLHDCVDCIHGKNNIFDSPCSHCWTIHGKHKPLFVAKA